MYRRYLTTNHPGGVFGCIMFHSKSLPSPHLAIKSIESFASSGPWGDKCRCSASGGDRIGAETTDWLGLEIGLSGVRKYSIIIDCLGSQHVCR